jgi:hypothetical protein
MVVALLVDLSLAWMTEVEVVVVLVGGVLASHANLLIFDRFLFFL